MLRSPKALLPLLAFLALILGLPLPGLNGTSTASASSAVYGAPGHGHFVYLPGYEPRRAAPTRAMKRQQLAKQRLAKQRQLAGIPRKAKMSPERRRALQQAKYRQEMRRKALQSKRLAARTQVMDQRFEPELQRTFRDEPRHTAPRAERRYASLGDVQEQRQRRSEMAAVGHVEARVDIRSQRMIVKVDGEVRHVWKVSTGRKGFSTPRGTYRPGRMHQSYFSRKYYNSPMPYSIFFRGGYAIHGTNAINRLGGVASHGCVRLATGNARALFSLVRQAGAGRTRIIIT